MRNNNVDRIITLISKDEIEKAIELLQGLTSNSALFKEAIMHSAKHNQIKKDIRRGFLSNEKKGVELAKLRANLLDLVFEIKEKFKLNQELYEDVIYHSQRRITTIPDKKFTVGREEIIAEIFSKLQTNKMVCLSGIGGIGKTSIAVSFIQSDLCKQYDNIGFFEVQTTIKESFFSNLDFLAKIGLTRDELAELKTHLLVIDQKSGLLQVDNRDGANSNIIKFKILIHYLNLKAKNLLIVIDGIDDPKGLNESLHLLKDLNASILLTSRIKPEFKDLPVIEVNPLSKEELMAIFSFYYPLENIEHNKIVFEIISRLHYHTFSIELVAKAGKASNVELRKLNNLISEGLFFNSELQAEIEIDNYKRIGIVKTKIKLRNFLRLIFQEVSALNNQEILYLRYLALFPPKTLSIEEIVYFIYIKDEVNKRVEVINTTKALYEKGWLIKESEYSFSLHPFVREFVLEELEPNLKTNCKILLSSPVFLLFKGRDLFFNGDFSKAIYFLDEARRSSISNGGGSIDIVRISFEIAKCYIYSDRFIKANNLLKRLINIFPSVLGYESIEYANFLYHLGANFININQEEKGLLVWEEAKKIALYQKFQTGKGSQLCDRLDVEIDMVKSFCKLDDVIHKNNKWKKIVRNNIWY